MAVEMMPPTSETIQLISSALETVNEALKKPKEAAHWDQARIELEKAVDALPPQNSSPPSPSVKPSVVRGSEVEALQDQVVESFGRSTNLLEKVTESIRIDPSVFYLSTEGEDASRRSKDEWVKNQSKETKLLDIKIQCVSALLNLIETLFLRSHQNHCHFELPKQGSTAAGPNYNEEKVNTIGLSFEALSGLIFYLSAWCSVGYSIDEWVLDHDLGRRNQNLIERLWKLLPLLKRTTSRIQARPHDPKTYEKTLELEYGHLILNDFIKPLFMKQGSFSNQINLKTGRSKVRQDSKQDQLFGPTFNASGELFNNPLWKIHGVGFWNSVCLLLDRLHQAEMDSKKQEPGINEIWPLLIPPIITLLEETHPRYRLRGLQLSISLLENAPPHLICQTGINNLLQKSYSNTFGLLNIQETIELLNASFDANVKLIKVEWEFSGKKDSKDQANRYNKINQLFYQAIFNALVFRKSHSHSEEEDSSSYNLELLEFVVTRFTQLTELLGFAIGRYIQIIIPYLIESLTNIQELNLTNYKLIIRINELIKLLFKECGEVLMEWRSRLVIVFACCWQEWRSLDDNDEKLVNMPHLSTRNNTTCKEGDRIGDIEIELVKNSIIQDVFKSFISPICVQKPQQEILSSSRTTLNQKNDDGSNLHQRAKPKQEEEKEEVIIINQNETTQLLNLIHSISQKHPDLSELFSSFL